LIKTLENISFEPFFLIKKSLTILFVKIIIPIDKYPVIHCNDSFVSVETEITAASVFAKLEKKLVI
jgi:hypothetical protein